MFGKKENCIGLDIGSHVAKMIQVNVKSETFKLMDIGMVPLPREAFTEGRMSRADLVSNSIRQLVNNLKLKTKTTVASVSGYEVMIKRIELPMMTEEELDNRLHAELGQYIPYNIEEVDVDYQVLDIARERANYMDVMLVAAKKESISDYVNLIRQSGLDPLIIDVDFFALSNAFEATYGFSDDVVALIDIGANKAIINIVHRGVPVFTRGVPIGGSQITERIRDHFKISYEEAERIKLGEISDELRAQELQKICVSVVRNWVGECKRAIDFYYSNYPDNRIAKIYLSGGSCRIAGLDRVLQEHIGIDVDIFNPLAQMECNPKVFDPEYIESIGPQMAIALGLALRRMKEK
jgi:type IV pilus assembly protein PilM